MVAVLFECLQYVGGNPTPNVGPSFLVLYLGFEDS